MCCMCSDELKQQCETRIAQERAVMEEKQAKEIQVSFTKIVAFNLYNSLT